MKLCHPSIHLAIIFIGLTTSVCGQVAVTSSKASSTDALQDLKPGVVVEDVKKNSAADKAGIRVGDVILRWSRGDANGQVESPFDLIEAEIEQGSRGMIALEGIRGTEELRWLVQPDTWDLTTRPNFIGYLLELHQRGVDAAGTEKWAGEVERSFGLRATATNSPRWLNAWFLWRSAESLAGEKQWDKADVPCQQAVQQLKSGGSALAALLLKKCADIFLQEDSSARSERYYQEALAAIQEARPMSLSMAMILSSWGRLAYTNDDLPRAEEFLGRAVAIQQQLAPGSLALALSLNRLGVFLQDSGDLDKSARYIRQSLAIREELVPNSRAVAIALENLSNTFVMHGDLEKAEPYLLRALELWEKLDPEGLLVAGCLLDLSNDVVARGDLAKGELLLRRALAIQKRLAPNGRGVSSSLNNLGLILQQRGQLAEAEESFKQALALKTINSLDAALSIENLGELSRDRGNLAEAERWLRQAVAVREKLAPKSLLLGTAYSAMGDVELQRGNLVAAEDQYQKALGIEEVVAPGSQEKANTLKMLGDVAWKKGDTAGAERNYLSALQLQEKLASESVAYADILFSLADTKLHTGQLEIGKQMFAQALTALESQTARLGGSEDVRSGFRATHADYYKDYVDLLVLQKQPELAFQVLERSRARTLLETLAEGHVDIRKGVDASLLEQERSLQADIAAKSDRRIRLLGDKHTDEQLAAVNKEINDLVAQSQDVKGQIRASSPGYAALTQPQPLTAKQVQQQLLDDDTLLLEYSLGEERSYVFAVTPGSLAAYELPKRAEIERTARSVYDILIARNHIRKGETEAQRIVRIAAAEAQYPEEARALSRMILGPVASLLQRKRLLIVSDGVLQYIPLAALPSSGDQATLVPLVVGHEIVSLPSASVLGVLRKESAGRAKPAKAVAVLADPVFDVDDVRVRSGQKAPVMLTTTAGRGELDTEGLSASASRLEAPLLRSAMEIGAVDRGMGFARLFFARREADAILKETPPGQGMEAVDFQASRTTATSPELAGYRIVHFATHGLLNSEHPELSGLVLSLVNQQGKAQNGFLQLEDIYNLSLPVDMVVLSACETALGKEIRGEGLVGLTRGFMYAGATRVVASLWKVDDAATAELMGRFYKGVLKDGLQPAAALQRAQVEMRKQKRWTAPYYWAGFVMQGQW